MQGRDAPVVAAEMPLLYPDTASSVQPCSSTSNVPAATIPHAHKALSLALGRRRLRFEKHRHGLLLVGRKTQEDMFLVELPRKTQVAATLSLARDRLDVKATVRGARDDPLPLSASGCARHGALGHRSSLLVDDHSVGPTCVPYILRRSGRGTSWCEG